MRVKIKSDRIRRKLARLQTHLDKVPSRAERYFKSVTPVRSGNARRQTDLRDNTIVADYNYAQPLNKGKSRQAPKGMTEPTIDYIRLLVKRAIFRS